MVLLALALLGCGGPGAASPTLTALPTPTVTPRAVTADELAGVEVVTLVDYGRTITIHVGERFLLSLGSGAEYEAYSWEVIPADTSVLSRVPNMLPIQGSQGLYEAQDPGRTELSATGEAACRQGQPPCAAPTRFFSVQIVVEP